MTGTRAHRTAWAIAVLAVILGGCGRHATDSVAPPPPSSPPPAIHAVSPAPRTAFVEYGTTIWAEFVDPLDPLTVNTKNVFLKIDTTRLPITVGYSASTHRIIVTPQSPLQINTTYTVELSGNLVSAAGVPLGTAYLWQFTTTSVRHPTNPFPIVGAVESPFTELTFGGNETTPGILFYEIYAGPDSAAVAARAVPRLQRTQGAAGTLFIPRVRWTEQAPTYWSVTIENATVGERSNGPVWRFDTPGAGAAVDSMVVATSIWGYRPNVGSISNLCRQRDIFTGPLSPATSYTGGILWLLASLPHTMKLAGAKIEMSSSLAYQDSVPGCAAGVWLASSTPGCNFGLTGATDEINGHLAVGVPIGPRTVRFDSDTLIAHMSAAVRGRSFFGYFFRTAKYVDWLSPSNPETQSVPVLKLYYYVAATPQAAPARGVRANASGSGQPSAPARAGAVFPLDPEPVAPANFR